MFPDTRIKLIGVAGTAMKLKTVGPPSLNALVGAAILLLSSGADESPSTREHNVGTSETKALSHAGDVDD